jgi:hypothetical protein
MALHSQALNWLKATSIFEVILVVGFFVGRGKKLSPFQQGRYDVMRYGSIVGGIAIVGSAVVLILAEFLK